ncbi:solute carrier family 22 member 1-like [Symsagittifera roscoffensis]|uniref:solute carrier family 22 member 1-like n=1 Tax=Symsagittifera roscoffensis TaxID=84072 RepID=UPI00307C2E81
MISPAFYRLRVPYTCRDQDENMSPDSTEKVQTSLDQPATFDNSDTCSDKDFNYSAIDGKTSIHQSFDLVCEDEIYLMFHGGAYFLRMCFGSVLGGYLSDKMGRKKFFQLSCIFGLTLSTWIAFSESFIVHLICFCAVSAFEIGSFISMFALLVEAGSANTRFAASLLCRLSFTVGVPLCAPLALIFENWRHLVLAISCLIFLGLFTSLFTDESPRWLWAEGRYDLSTQKRICSTRNR